MKSIWVIEQGSYSDYRVVGVFSSEKNAQTVLQHLKDEYESPSIAEWELDPGVEELNKGYTCWVGEMLKDGTVERCEPIELDYYRLCKSLYIWRRSEASAFKGRGLLDCLTGTVLAKDQKHAIKIFNEYRTQLLANNKWDKEAQ